MVSIAFYRDMTDTYQIKITDFFQFGFSVKTHYFTCVFKNVYVLSN